MAHGDSDSLEHLTETLSGGMTASMETVVQLVEILFRKGILTPEELTAVIQPLKVYRKTMQRISAECAAARR